jgi:hypothetical protein
MPWRDDIETDAVSYSDRPKEDGPAPVVNEHSTGKVIELQLTDGKTVHDSQFQFWVQKDGNRKCAPYMAWEIAGQSGDYGVFDVHTKKIWFGPQEVVLDGSPFSYVELTEDWRKKIHWEDMVDRLWGAKRQYSHEQTGALEEVATNDLVNEQNTSSIYRTKIETYRSEEGELYIQFWRPENSQTVFVATRLEGFDRGTARTCKRGVIDEAGILPDDGGDAITLEDDPLRTVLTAVEDLRDDDISGLAST